MFSVVPFLNFLSLGYLLEVSGRVARTKRLRDGFVGVRKAAVFGRIVFGAWLMMWPARFVSGMWQDAELIASGSKVAIGWRIALYLITILTVGHIVWACLRGGKLRHFFWPAPLRLFRWLKQDDKFGGVQQAVIDYLFNLRLGYYFKLGAFGFLGGLIWLMIPVSILIFASFTPPGLAFLISLVGGGLLLLVAMYLPFVQAYYATENRFAAMFELGRVRQLFRQAPIAFWTALLITLLFAIPLYLLKIEFPPKEIAWLPSLLFMVFIFPARLLTGWALGRALQREQPRHFIFRWMARLAALPVAFFYVFIVYLTQYLSWNGVFSLFEQHAFLVPAPMLSM
ncbi:MAG: hypothetical protein K0Q55_3794 [Verrucomicrobia bacterium]|nr:hypothetical protein [Verrucomicrobiota bacterium]